MATSQFEVKVVPTKKEYARLVEVLWAANYNRWNGYDAFFTAIHPVNGHSDEHRARDKAHDTETRWEESSKNPYSHLIYVIHKETGDVAGGCEWLIYHENPFPNGPQPVKYTWYPEGTERAEFAECFLSQLFFPRQSWFQRPHAGVNSLGVHPKYECRAVGRLLLEWGHRIIDLLGYESFVEVKEIDRLVYEQNGYRRLMGLHIDLFKWKPSQDWLTLAHGRRPLEILLFWRPPLGEWTEEVPCGSWAVSEDTFK